MTHDLEANKALVVRFLSAVEAGDFAAIDELVAVDYDDHLAGQGRGRDTLRTYLAAVRAAFPDLRWPIVHIVAEGDLVAVLNGVEGTHLGDFGELRATGKRIDMPAFQLYRIADGKLAEHWEVADYATLQRQLGT